MKKTNQTFKTIIAIAVVTVFVACKKEILQPQSTATPKAIITDQPTNLRTKNPIVTHDDSTATKKVN